MSLPNELQRLAIEIAKDVQKSMPDAQAELRAMQTRMAEIQSELATAKTASQRALDFQFKVGTDYQCPRCWVSRGAHSTITPIPGNGADDVFICRTCLLEIAIPIGQR